MKNSGLPGPLIYGQKPRLSPLKNSRFHGPLIFGHKRRLSPLKSIYIRQVNEYPISFVLFVLHCKFNNQHNRKTKVAFDEKTTGPFDVYPCLFTF